MVDEEHVLAHRANGMKPENPVVRGTSQNPDVFFQARESCNPFYDATPGMVQAAMDQLFELTGRRYNLFDYVGHPEAEKVVVLMGSGTGPVREVVERRTGADWTWFFDQWVMKGGQPTYVSAWANGKVGGKEV